MKKILLFLMFLLGIYTISITTFEIGEKINNKFVSKYETWKSNLTEEELSEYYLNNDIRPASFPANSGNKRLKLVEVAAYLEDEFPSYTNWQVSNGSYVKDIYMVLILKR